MAGCLIRSWVQEASAARVSALVNEHGWALTAQALRFTLVAKVRQRRMPGVGRMRSYKVLLFWIEVTLAVLTGVLGVVTLFWRDWMEALTGWSPDHHSGSVEFGLVSVLLIMSVSCMAVARSTHRRLVALSG